MFRFHPFHPSLAAGAFATVAALTSPAVHAQAPDLATLQAKTIAVSITQYGIVRSASVTPDMPPVLHLAVTQTDQIVIEKPDKVRLATKLTEEGAPPEAADASRTMLLVSDGETAYDYLGQMNQYFVNKVQPGTRGFYVAAVLDAIFGLDREALSHYVSSGRDTLDGKSLFLYVYRHDEKIGKRAFTRIDKLWVDPTTRLPTRYSAWITADGKTKETLRSEFSDWKIDAPVDHSLFVWTAPAGATVYKAP